MSPKSTAVAIPDARSAILERDRLSDLISRWSGRLGLLKASGQISAATAETYRRGSTRYLEWCAAARLPPERADTILAWKADLAVADYKPGTINAWYAGVRALFAWVVAEGALPASPCDQIKAEKRSTVHKRDELTPEEMRRLLDTLDHSTPAGARDAAIITLMAYTAVRTIEVHRADLADLRTVQGQLALAIHGKGRHEADEYAVLAHASARRAMYDWLAQRGRAAGPLFLSLSDRNPLGSAQHGRLSLGAIRKIVKDHYAAAGIVDGRKTTHSLRHTAITTYIRATGNPIGAKRLARHASIETTMIYVHEADRFADPPEAHIDYGEGVSDVAEGV